MFCFPLGRRFSLQRQGGPGALGRLRRLAAAGTCSLAILVGAVAAPGSARAEDAATTLSPLGFLGAGPGDGLAEVLLPYSPYIFDAVVTVSRSLVAVTYRSRGYDAATGDFVVTGLKVGRDGIDVAVERIRVNASTGLYEGIVIDTRKIPMEPDARKTLADLGAEVIRGDIVTSVSADVPSATYDIELSADFEDLGALGVAAKVEGFHLLVPLDDVSEAIEPTPPMDGEMPAEPASPSDVPILLGRLHSASITYDDAGLTSAGFSLAAEAQNIAPNELRGMMAMMLTPLISSLFESLPGGAGPELTERSVGWSSTIQAYLADPQHLAVTFSPEEPFDLSQIKPGQTLSEAMILSLNPEVSNVATERTALVDPSSGTVTGADDMPLAERLVEGYGVPQDVGRGVALALADLAAGKAEAADIVVRGIVLDPSSAVSDDTAAASYTTLLLAKARGLAVPDGAMAAVRARLGVTEVAAAENAALTQWRGTEAGAASEEAETTVIVSRDWSAIRDLAFDYYEGQTVPRNLTRAFTLAQIAAAGGDRIAVTLRDDLTAGLAAQRLAFDAAAGRTEAGAIWSQLVASAATEAEAGASSDAPATEEAPAPQ